MLKGLVIKPYWADLILDGRKTWEIRGSATKHRGPFYIIKSGSGQVCGAARIVDCIPFTLDRFRKDYSKHRIDDERLFHRYNQSWAWVIEDAMEFREPIPYQHPKGAVIWVNIPHSIIDGTIDWV